jgi:hypothetical protein
MMLPWRNFEPEANPQASKLLLNIPGVPAYAQKLIENLTFRL